jgi:hypothetical protein
MGVKRGFKGVLVHLILRSFIPPPIALPFRFIVHEVRLIPCKARFASPVHGAGIQRVLKKSEIDEKHPSGAKEAAEKVGKLSESCEEAYLRG